MPRRSMIEAIRDAMDVSMARDERVIVYGEDVGFFGGVFRVTHGLQAFYGKSELKAPGGNVYEKIEGLTRLANGDWFIVNDNDGVDDGANSGETQLIKLGPLANN